MLFFFYKADLAVYTLHCTASDRQINMIEGECHSPLAGRQPVRITPRCSVESVEERK